ncbi:MAG: sulfatase [Planctomycetota bacterium]
MKRRDFLRAMTAGASTLLMRGLLSAKGLSRPKPNIVFCLADDQGWHQLSCYGSDFYDTPNIDRLAAEGMRFTDAYAAAPVCSPTRASIMTGKYPARLHLTDYIPGSTRADRKLQAPVWTKYLPLEEVTLAEALKTAGYVCGHFGKWHLNKDKNYKPGRPGDPGSQGFDEVLTTTKPKSSADPYADPHHVKEITDRSIAFIKANKDRPFFCYVTHNTIHRPETERTELLAKYEAKAGANDDQNRPVLGAMVETLDKSVGRILDALDQAKIADNTIVIYFADNGQLRRREEPRPLRSGKGHLYEGGIREPLIVRWPHAVRTGSQCRVPVISVDFFPTLLEAAGLKVADPTVDGESIMPLLRQTGGLKRDAIYFHYPHYSPQGGSPAGAIRQGDYKLIEWFEKSVDGCDTENALELFNLRADIGEQHNLAGQMPAMTARLHRKLKQWRKSVNAQQMVSNAQRNPNTKK